MSIFSSRKVASGVLALSVFVSVFGFGGGALAGKRREAMRVFDEGTDTTLAVRFSMDAYLENCAAYARTMAEETRLRVSSDAKAAERALELCDIVADGEIAARESAYAELCGCVEQMFTDFHASVDSESERRTFDRAYDDYQAEVSKISYDGYHSLARDFNRLRDQMPAKWVAGLYQLDELETF